MLRALLAGLCVFLTLNVARADDAIWSALVLATNETKPMPPPAELQKFSGRMRNVFGYNQFEIIGSHTELMDDRTECWLVPSKSFSLRVKAKEGERDERTLSLQLFQKETLLVETKAHLGQQSPLFIRGPLYGTGQLIIVLSVK